ncbi:MAG: phosphatidate cytidylyltransferase [Pirellulales bacterium]
MLRWRILLGAGLIAALAAMIVLDYRAPTPGVWLLVVALIVGLGGAQEVISLMAAGGHHPRASVIYAGTLVVIASNAIPILWRAVPEAQALERLAWPMLAFSATVGAAFVGEMRRYQRPGGVTVNIALAVLGVAYLGITLSFAAQLRLLGGPAEGIVALSAMVIVVKMGDTGAYAVGRMLGRHKMAPVLSPGKTWEGAAGGLALACLASWLAFTFLPGAFGHTLSVRPGSWLFFGLAVGIAGMVGDLAESLLKRDAGRKDSSTWMPGFGGVLDILDSILFAAPVAYFCWWLCMR